MSPSSRPPGPTVDAARARRARSSALAEEGYDVPCVWALDTDGPGAVAEWPAAAEALYRVPARVALGQPRRALLASAPAAGTWADVDTALRAHGRWEGELLHTTPDGRALRTETRLVRAPDPPPAPPPAPGDGAAPWPPASPFVVEIARDVTAQRAAEDERERLIATLETERAQLAEFALRAEAARAEAETARREAEGASLAKSAFLATMSHELRTPLNAVLGYAELLDLGIAGPVTEAHHQYLDRIVASGRHLLGLITDVLDLGQIETGEMAVRRQPHPAHAALRAALAHVRQHAAARGIQLDVPDAPAGEVGPTYLGDDRRVQQVLVNLLGNAVKFTEPGGDVAVTCALTRELPADARVAPRAAGRGAWVTVRVEDTGIGIPPEQQEQVFARFHQLDHAAAGPYRRTQGGTGLGLALSRELARLMGGDLTLESAPGRGSTFTLWLPAAVPAVRAAADATDRPTAAVGTLLADAVPAVVAAWGERLGADPLVPQARALGRAQLEDHVPSYLADLAQQFVIFDDPQASGARVALVRDGTRVRALLARQHGRQRARLGWTEAALAREFALLGEEIERALAVRLTDIPPGTVDDARALVRAWLGIGARESAEALRAAVRDEPASSAQDEPHPDGSHQDGPHAGGRRAPAA